MRARNLKPGFFKNELLGSADPLIGTLFQGLWLMADREGRLEDRPLRFSGEIFPYRKAVTETRVNKYLDWLHAHGFISRYAAEGGRFIQVIEFTSHQNPHKDERPSKIPGLSSFSHRASTVVAPGDLGGKPEVVGLNPESGILNPESSLRERARAGGPTPGEHGAEGNGGAIDRGTALTGQQSATDSSGLDAWRDAGCDAQAMEAWLEHLAALSPPKQLAGHARIHTAQMLRGMGNAESQRRAVQMAAANGWKNLRHTDAQANGPAGTGKKTFEERMAPLYAAAGSEDAA